MRAPQLARLIVAAVACSTLAGTASAEPQWPRDRRQPGLERQGRPNGEAYTRGYREGFRDGEEDGRRGRAFNIERNRAYRSADQGYERNDGPRELYRTRFRQGFSEGYRSGFERARGNRNGVLGRDRDGDRRDGPTRPAIYRDPAQARGYSDGYSKGLEDRRDNDRFDVTRHKDYRKADQGYSRSYGSKDRYKNEYREGFRQGYEDGFRGNFGRR